RGALVGGVFAAARGEHGRGGGRGCDEQNGSLHVSSEGESRWVTGAARIIGGTRRFVSCANYENGGRSCARFGDGSRSTTVTRSKLSPSIGAVIRRPSYSTARRRA